uniref:Uncharacterized protein n=1 Tax=Magallana gigas TaxID=29159 RepID=K1QCQ7_MAGGI
MSALPAYDGADGRWGSSVRAPASPDSRNHQRLTLSKPFLTLPAIMNPFAPYSSKQEARAPLSDRELNNGAPLNDMESQSMPITG